MTWRRKVEITLVRSLHGHYPAIQNRRAPIYLSLRLPIRQTNNTYQYPHPHPSHSDGAIPRPHHRTATIKYIPIPLQSLSLAHISQHWESCQPNPHQSRDAHQSLDRRDDGYGKPSSESSISSPSQLIKSATLASSRSTHLRLQSLCRLTLSLDSSASLDRERESSPRRANLLRRPDVNRGAEDCNLGESEEEGLDTGTLGSSRSIGTPSSPSSLLSSSFSSSSAPGWPGSKRSCRLALSLDFSSASLCGERTSSARYANLLRRLPAW